MTQIVAAPDAASVEVPEPRRGGPLVWRIIRSNPSATVGLVILLLVIVAAVLAPVLAPTALYQQVGVPFEPPSLKGPAYWLGLDDGGQSMVTDLLYGTQVSLIVGFSATALAIVLGTFLGLLSGYFGGATDSGINWVTNFFLVIPEVPLMIVIAAIWGQGMWKMVFVIGILLWTWTTRVIRAQVKSVKERVYVKRARALGAPHGRTIVQHVLPQVAPLIVVNTVLTVAVAIFDETALSFLGLGDPDRLSLGKLIEYASEREAVTNGAWWAIVLPGLVVTIIILSLTLMGTALEDALNPRLRVSHLSRKHFLLLPNRSTGASRMLEHQRPATGLEPGAVPAPVPEPGAPDGTAP